MRDLGDLGELHFNAWCSEIGLIANKSTKDKMGWDFIVEFPFSNEITGLAVHQSAPKCKVQVKATDGQERKLSISLSNLRKLAVDPLPCFYIFIEYESTNQPVRAFLRHMDEELIEKTLKLFTTTKQKSYTIHYDKSHQLSDLTGKSLASKLKFYIEDLHDYTFRKKKFLENVGYDDERFNIKFDIIGKENLEELVDVCIGIKDRTNISNLTAFEKRFGQLYEKSDFSAASAELSLTKLEPTDKAKIIFRKGGIGNDFRFDVEVYIPYFLGDFNHPLFKSRYKSSFFELTLKHKSNKLGFSFNFGARLFRLRDLRKYLKFIYEVSGGDTFKVLINGGGGQEVLGSISSNGERVDYSDSIETLNTLIRITQLFNVVDDVCISYEEMESLASSCSDIFDFYSGNAIRFRISFDIVDGKLTLGNNVVLLGAIRYQIGNIILYTLYSAEGEIEKSEDTEREFEVNGPKITILEKISTNISSPIPVEDIYDELSKLEGDYDDKPVIIMRK
ncbi:DUF4365 domain-containing protein [Shewanella insulae]|uniref:DUF4365 domain-containing protein n=1 Tax=Shewanella insulae TaxID=2681496 RepID=UPI001EFD68E6|nr:DUF4365 domain-containing protein [Shewanella insulae]MCG9738858.1 DUF4365 domain-containing protein [Shewanella insulae]